MEALEIYKKLSQPPKGALREIEAGDLKGKTDINPQWRYEAMTEQFGLVGIGWKYEIQKLWTEPGARDETLAFAQVAVYVRDPQTKEWSDPIVGIGGSKLINNFTNGLKSNDEGYKMAVTDAFSTSLKMIGVAADIYAGRWDGSKYNEEPCNKGEDTPQKSSRGPTQPSPAGGPDTPEEAKRINELIRTKNSKGEYIFTKGEVNGLGKMRMSRTAQEVIQWLNMEATARTKPKADPEPEPFPEDPLPGEELNLSSKDEKALEDIF